MHTNFRIELAKLFALVSIGLVIFSGLVAKVSIYTLFIRVLIGGGIFTIIGYFIGGVINQQKDEQLVEAQKQKIKARIRANYDQTVKGSQKSVDDFSPLEVEKLTKIIVDSMDE